MHQLIYVQQLKGEREVKFIKMLTFVLFPKTAATPWPTVLRFNNTSTLVGHLCCLPEKGRKEIEEIAEEMREGKGRNRKMKESEGTEEITTLSLYPYLLQGQQALPNCKPVSVGHPSDKSYRIPFSHQQLPSLPGNPLDVLK